MAFDGEDYTVHATIAVVSADTAAAHDLFGLLGPAAKHFCRLCKISREDLLNGRYGAAAIRTKDLYEQELAYVKERPSAARQTETGIAGDCALHVCSFRLYENWTLDILHDLFEGIVQYTLKLVIHHFVIIRGVCSIPDLNRLIYAFKYGPTDTKNKPSSNFTAPTLQNLADHTLKQKGAQVWCLLRIFPFLFNNLIERGDEHMEVVLLLVRIVEILVAPKIPKSILPLLSDMINDYLDLFIELFPNQPLINKHHHLVHYVECIRQTGPPVHLWTMRFEGANAILSRHGKVMCNFQNAPLTLVRVGQFRQMETWGHDKYSTGRVSSLQGACVSVDNLLCGQFLRDSGITDSVFTTTQVSVKGTKYKVSMFVCLKSKEVSNNLPLFGKIREIVIVRQRSVHMFVSLQRPTGFDPDFHAYPVLDSSPQDEMMLVSVDTLADYKPLSAWRAPDWPDRVFLSFHHLVC